ncbi:MAG: glutamate--tRNA ligase [Clostridia bacterium]|nr:glutamate--tRNA ligase [Clostridia bacterium]
MDYKKLANLLYPNLEHDMEYYLETTPKRNLPAGAQVTRIAPSPTGYLHLGHFYGALIDYLTAYKSNGVYYMRLEDTDQKREIEGAGQIAYDMLCTYGAKPNEGYRGDYNSEIGDYGPYVQSKRLPIYHAFAKKLVELGRAFPCFCEKSENKQDILDRRSEQLENNDDIESKDPCRSLSLEQIEENVKSGKKFALRLLSLGDSEKTIEVEDLVKGKRQIRENTKDIVLLKSNGIPVYAFAHLVDDTLMGTTIVVRGEEWFPSLSSHIELFDAFGFPRMKYAHTPVICKLDNDGNKRKLSKRKDPEADVRYYLEKGYPVVTVVEYLINLLNSDFEIWRNNNPHADYHEFDFKLSKISLNNPMFDFDKLDNVSKNLISLWTAEKVYDECLTWAEKYDLEWANTLKTNKNKSVALFSVERGIERPRKDIVNFSMVKDLYSYMFEETLNKNTLLSFNEKFDKNTVKDFLSAYKTSFSLDGDNSAWFTGVKAVAEQIGFCTNNKEYKANPEAYKGNTADACSILRVAITGREQTPDLFSLLKILGKTEVQNRIDYVLNNI